MFSFRFVPFSFYTDRGCRIKPLIATASAIFMNRCEINQAQVLAFGCAVIAICGTAICTLSACPLMGIIYSDIGIEYKGTAKYSVAFCAVMIVICAAILIPVGSGMFAGLI